MSNKPENSSSPSTTQILALAEAALQPEQKEALVANVNAQLAVDSVFNALPVEKFPTLEEAAASLAKIQEGRTTLTDSEIEAAFTEPSDFLQAP